MADENIERKWESNAELKDCIANVWMNGIGKAGGVYG